MGKFIRALLVDYDTDLFDLTLAVKAQMEQTLAGVGAVLEIGQHRTDEAVVAVAREADLVMVQSVRPLLNSRTIPQLQACRGIIRLGLGYDSVDLQAATQAGIPVSNVVEWCNEEVAEHTLALLMASVRKVPILDSILHSERWSRIEAAPVFRLHGKTVGLIGFGRIAQAVAQRLHGFGVTILVYDPYIDENFMQPFGVQKVGLEELCRRSDYVSVHARLTPETTHLLSERELGWMKPEAVLVNTSRGPIVDEGALVAALQQGRLRGAALDVMEKEPLAADSPLRQMANVILTPHLASYSLEAVGELYIKGAEIAADMLSGKWVRTIVNPQVRSAAEKRWGPAV